MKVTIRTKIHQIASRLCPPVLSGDVLIGSSDGSIHGLVPLSVLHLSPHVARAIVLAVVVVLVFPLTLKDKLGE